MLVERGRIRILALTDTLTPHCNKGTFPSGNDGAEAHCSESNARRGTRDETVGLLRLPMTVQSRTDVKSVRHRVDTLL